MAEQIKEPEKFEIKQYISNKMVFGTLPLTDELKKKAYKAIMDRFNGVKEEREERFRLYQYWQDLYLAREAGQSKETLSQVMTTYGFNFVEDWVALTMDAMFPVDPPFEIKGLKSEIKTSQTDYITRVLAGNMRKTDYEMEFERIDRQGLILGTLVSKGGWRIDEEPAIRVVEEDKVLKHEVDGESIETVVEGEEGEPVKERRVEEFIEIEDYPGYNFVQLNRLYFRADKLSWVIELINSNWSEIEKLEREKDGTGLYDNVEKAKETSYPGTTETPDYEQKDKDDATVTADIKKVDGDVELMEGHHIPVEIDGKKILCIVTVANRKEVVRVQPTPYKKVPYLFTQFFDSSGVEGKGLIEMIEKPLVEMNTRRNLSRDANTKGLYGMKAVNMKYIKKPEQLKIRPDGIIELKETDKPINQIIQFYRPPVEYATIAEELMDRMAQEMVRTSRMKGVLAGEKVTPQPSASEWTGMLKEALKSIKIILKRIAKGQIEEWLDRAYIMNVFNRQKSWRIPVELPQPQIPPAGMPAPGVQGPMPPTEVPQGPEWVEVTPEQIYTDGIDIRAIGVSYMEDTAVMRHQTMQEMEMMAKYGELPMFNDAGVPVGPDYYKQMTKMKIAFGSEDPKAEFRVLPPPPPPPPPAPPGMGGPGLPQPLGAGVPTEAGLMGGAMQVPPGVV